MTTPKEILHQYGIKPNKKLGQSFLIDINVINRIIGASDISGDDTVVEIGAGIGVMTEGIARKARRVIAVEIDRNLTLVLKDRLGGYDNVEVHSGDILKFDFKSVAEAHKTKIRIIGNVPYNISSPLVFRLISFRPVISDFMLMLQKEIVQRLVSVPDNRIYGVPSVILQMFAAAERLFDVPSTCFYPRPKVESAIVRGEFPEKPFVPLQDEIFFTGLVKAAFAQRRKMLINNLKNSRLLERLSEAELKSALEAAGIDGKRRGESLSVSEFGNLSNILGRMGGAVNL